METPPIPQAGKDILDWALDVANWLRRSRITVSPGFGLASRETADGVTIGLSLPRYSIGVTTGTISARSGATPGSGTVQPYLFNGKTYVQFGNPITVFNKSKQTIASGYWVTWNFIDGFPHYDWSDCTAG